MSKRIYFDFSYFIILAATFGAIMVLGPIVAPVVFHSNEILIGVTLDKYNSGIIMGEIFHRFSYWVYALAFYVFVYEALLYKSGKRDTIALISAATVIFSSIMFSAVYAPKILAMQALGMEATQSDTFANIHFASELDFKILAISLILLFVRRLMLLRLS
ncbi:DUF4149 domain-containing protein [Candidatus Sulfurimonas marisnigri]|uniref:DUF4149 domain-containing protein n=1 Tax=Candidatus Sulfurimonas marisnigri TaxID=2740405 RepID=A0A7S7LYM2_9BACT|nr:DUF4149 domain-containing protein [Candidatus Sulfurimonas marisnigri]QOY53888.1 DUF4149 domain-containing protein [Candidatus Sulfurimonas marisnigri]